MKRRWLLVPLLVVVFLLLGTAVSSAAPPPQAGPPDFVRGQILVKFMPGTAGQAVADAHRQNGGQVDRTIPGVDVQVVRVPAGQETARVAAYASNPNVLFAEVNGFYNAIWNENGEPNDGLVGRQWQYNNGNDADIDAFEAWALDSRRGTGVKVAVLDTGIDQSHPDLSGKIAEQRDFTDSDTVDDRYGHGTHVAGSVAAITDNTIGVAGTAPNASLVNGKVLNDDGSGAWDWIASGIIWATDTADAKVISMSLGGRWGSSTVESAINYAWDNGVVVVAAAGNERTKNPSYPAYYAHSIAVAATDSNDHKASYSNWGDWVDVAAPGSSILSTAPDHANTIWGSGVSYGTISGTSMATPHVAGLAALLWSDAPSEATAQQIRDLIEQNADKIDGTGQYWVYGRINAYNSLSALLGASGGGDVTNNPPVASNDSYSTSEDTALVISAPGVLSNDTDAETDPLTAVLVSGPSNGSLALNANGSFNYTPIANFNGPDSFSYRANDGSANSNSATVTIAVSAVNDAPIANDQSVTTDKNASASITLTGSDIDGDGLSFSVVDEPSHGSLSGTSPNLVYTPATDYAGADSFTFRSNDGALDSSVATVTITVNGSAGGGTEPLTISSIDNTDDSAAAGSSASVKGGTSAALVIYGSGILSGATVTFENGAGPTPAASSIVVGADGTSIQFSVATSKTPKPRTWSVRVTNPGGASDVLTDGLVVTP